VILVGKTDKKIASKDWDLVFKQKDEPKRANKFIVFFYNNYLKNSKDIKILDIGSGTGRHSIYLAKKGLEVFALDSSELALKHNVSSFDINCSCTYCFMKYFVK
jgi:2-polyprenyl-3-methyl-5-hydroxy-6-metoxy-1,4-benzoquinol methylase